MHQGLSLNHLLVTHSRYIVGQLPRCPLHRESAVPRKHF